ncbi:glycosyltransferase [Silicimonas algicola]|uniref:glycosyltransferase n=1 Tax=Silicimonas algicola TaxID=1826607 RepID=UPI0011B1F153|nr:glycosyltransferase [Silicimonas algicola]
MKEADTLHMSGYDVEVIATKLADFVEPRDQSIMAAAPWRLKRVTFDNRWLWRLGRSLQIVARLLRTFTPSRRLDMLALSPMSRHLVRAASARSADLFIAHYPAALPAAAAAARRHGTQYAYDAEDFHLGEWPDDPAYDTERRLVHAIEGRYLPSCAYVTAASPLIAEALVETYGIEPPHVVLNVFPRSQAPAAPTTQGSAAPRPSLYWFSQTIGPNRGLECAVRAIGLSAYRPHLYLRGTPAVGYVAQLEKIAGETGAQGRVHVLPPASPDQMENLAAHHDLGLASEVPVSRNREVCLTNKLFSFLLAGLPPLMSATPAQRRFAAESGLADLVYPVDDAPALAALIDRLLSAPDGLASLREQIWRLGQERYNWDVERNLIRSAIQGIKC